VLINYWRSDRRDSTRNLVVARVGLAGYAIWKLLSYDFVVLRGWPRALFSAHPLGGLRVPPESLGALPLEVAVAIAALLAFACGRWLRLTSFLAALLIAHLVGLHYVVTNSGTTFLPAVYILLLWGLFADQDGPGLAARSDPDGGLVRLSALRWALLAFAATYFFTGTSKLVKVGLDWAAPEHLALILHREAVMHLAGLPWLASLLIEHPVLAGASAGLTLLLECGFLPAILLGLPVLPFAIGLLGMHTMIVATMGIFFFDQYLLFSLFVPWDRLWRTRSIDAIRPFS
jgi:hypothetical protein